MYTQHTFANFDTIFSALEAVMPHPVDSDKNTGTHNISSIIVSPITYMASHIYGTVLSRNATSRRETDILAAAGTLTKSVETGQPH